MLALGCIQRVMVRQQVKHISLSILCPIIRAWSWVNLIKNIKKLIVIQDAHSAKIAIPVAAPAGTTALVAANPDAWIYIHEIVGDLASAGSVEFKAGTRSLAKFTLDPGQGITQQDEPGNDNVPRFMCRPGEAFNIVVTGGQFDGALDYSLRY
jgi:hypothetical protein